MAAEISTSSPHRVRLAARLLRPPARGLDVITGLRHFAIVSYLVPIERLSPHVDPRFSITQVDGRGLVSVVTFHDVDFRFARFPFLRFNFGQTNYRLYVEDADGDPIAWFFGTSLASPWVAVPRLAWGLPWHYARMRSQIDYAVQERRYRRYRLTTRSRWAPMELEIEDTGEPMSLLPGFDDLEHQGLVLTHPVRGVYFRRDRTVGTYSIWHEEMRLTNGRVTHARFDLLRRMELLDDAEMSSPHSVLLAPEVEFQVHLPPSLHQIHPAPALQR